MIVAKPAVVYKPVPNASLYFSYGTSFDPSADTDDVPDPYYGDIRDFEEVANMLERICDGILLSAQHIDH